MRPQRLWKHATVMFLSASLAALAVEPSRSDVQLETDASPQEIFIGEPLRLTLWVRNYDPAMGLPDLSGIPGEVSLVGQQDRSHQSVRIVNGVREVTEFSGRVFEYTITPAQTGTFDLGPIRVQDRNNQSVLSAGPSITVRPVPQQDHVQVWVEGPTASIVPDEPFTLTLKVRIRRLPSPYADHSPIPQGRPPHLHVPYLDGANDAPMESRNLQQNLQQRLVANGEAFRINNRMLAEAPFSLFRRDQPAWFRFEREIDPDDTGYFLYRFSSEWTASRETQLTIAPVRFRGTLLTGVSPQGQPFADDFYAVSDPITISVSQPPSEGRPANWIGASGYDFQIRTALDTQTCFVGDPLTLTLDITGQAPRNRIRTPRPSTLEPLADDFRIVGDPQTQDLPDGKRFQYVIRPHRAGTLEIPPLSISYFHLDSRTYETVSSAPLPLRVNAVTELTADGYPADAKRMRIQTAEGPIPLAPAPIRIHPTAHAYRLYHPVWHSLLFATGPLLFFSTGLLAWLRKNEPARARYRRRKQAISLARQQMDRAGETPGPQSNLAAVLRTYLSNRLSPSLRAASASDIRDFLQSRGIPDSLVAQVEHQLEDSVYAGNEQASRDQVLACRNTIDDLEKALHPTHKFHAKSFLIPLLLTLSTGTLLARTDDLSLRDFEARRAHDFLLRASEPENFLAAAEAHVARIEQGDRSPEIFYHLGTALLLAGHPRLAIPALQRAERRGGSQWDVRRNLLLAMRELHKDPSLDLPWYRKPLFLHFQYGIPTRITIVGLLFLALWLCWTARRIDRDVPHLRITLLLLFFLGCTSLTASLYAEWHAESQFRLIRNQIDRMITHGMEDPTQS